MPLDSERLLKPLSTEEELEMIAATGGATCVGIPQCSVGAKDFRPGKCHIDGCPRERLARLMAASQ